MAVKGEFSTLDKISREQGKRCFIITPIGDENSDIFRNAKGVIESSIKPILVKFGFNDVKPSYEIMESGMIGNQIINRIVNDDLVVANLTDNNPNVMYELAVRHAVAKPIIHICERKLETVLPFDIKDNRTIFYTNDMLGVTELQNCFEKYVANIDYSRDYKDNPIYSGIEMSKILKNIESIGKKTDSKLLQIVSNRIYNQDINNRVERQKVLFRDANMILNFQEASLQGYNGFLAEFEREALEKNVVILGTEFTLCYLKNRGALSSYEIGKIADSIAMKYNVKVSVKRNP